MAEPVSIWTGTYPNSRKPQSPYRVELFSDGSATCTCEDWIIRGRNSGNPNRRCKHIRKAIEENAPNLGEAAPSPSPVAASPTSEPAPQSGVVGALSLADIARAGRGRRRSN